MTTSGRSWAELLETLQGGLAVFDHEWRLAFVSDRFMTVLGQPDELVGQDLLDLLPALADDDPRGLRGHFESGTRIEFEQQFQTTDGELCWYRVTLVPSTILGSGLTAVVFAKDITATSRTLAQIRDATVGLTEVESELHSRVCREIHDGPIQLLAALMFRLGMGKTNDDRELQHAVSEVASTLRRMIEEFSPELSGTQSTLLEQWVAPLLVGTGTEMTIRDQRTTESGLAEAKAAFVLICHFVRAGTPTVHRTFDVAISDEKGGERIVLTSLSTHPTTLSAHKAARFRSSTHHARALGGTISTWLDDNDIRVTSMWIPKLTHPPDPPVMVGGRVLPTRIRNDVSLLPPLSNSGWQAIVSEAPERMIEFDDQMRISFANAVQEQAVGVGPAELIGLSADRMFSAETLAQLDNSFHQLDAGSFVETDWYRENAFGDARLIHLTLSPRLDETGQWQGLFLATEDEADVELLDDMYQAALSDLTLARRRAIEASIQRLKQPLADCEHLIDQIKRIEAATAHPEPVRNIITELEVTLRKIKNSTSVLGAPHHSISNLDVALRESLGPLLAGRQLAIFDSTETPTPPGISDILFRITREAVNNAVLHGKAEFISVTLANVNDGISCEIHDQGIGVDLAHLNHRPGHLGVRVMQERARERNGTCSIERDPRGGTLVSVWLPGEAGGPALVDGSLAPS